MSAREFSKVSPALWRSGRFMALDDAGKVQFVYFITNAHVNSSGVYHLPDGYACSDLQCSLEQYTQIRERLVAAGMVDWDEDYSLILIERWFKHNGPTNDDHATGTLRFLTNIESDRLREKALTDFNEANDRRIEKQAEKRAEQERKAANRSNMASQIIGASSALLNTRMMGGRRG